MDSYRLTTIDNPYDPFTEFSQWAIYDKDQGYNTSEYLARVADLSGNESETEENQIINDAIDFIIRTNPLKIYKKVKRHS